MPSFAAGITFVNCHSLVRCSRDDFGPKSDVDVLVEFEPDHIPGLIRFAGMEIELSKLLGGRKIDLNTPKFLSPYFRDEVFAEAEVQYVQA